MTHRSNFETGREHYLRHEYEEAVRHFMLGVAEGSVSCLGWLGQCYELGLGIEMNLSYAKDLYNSGYNNLTPVGRSGEFGLWLEKRLDVLKETPLPESESRHIDGLGNVRIIRSRYSYIPTKVRWNKDETVIEIEHRDSILSGFKYAEDHLPKLFSEWTCDGLNKFDDGYTLETDFFTLKVRQEETGGYKSIINGRDLTIIVPKTVSFEFLYVQKHILKKAKELLFKRAEVIIPEKLKEVSERIGASFKKCEIVMSSRSWIARNCYYGSKIQFCAKTIQLPEKSLEALCIHELTHNYILGHGRAFHKKMIMLGGEEACRLDRNLFNEGRWPYLKF